MTYPLDRDFPSLEGTSKLSPYLHFGLLSARTVFHRAEAQRVGLSPAERSGVDVFTNELIWREFYTHILAHFPHVATGPFRREYQSLRWPGNTDLFQAWAQGKTGYPLVDAAMRQLNTTGWMHNRLRMVTAMFLTKDLLLDWRLGERYFMLNLLDGNLAANNGGWQWSASTGTDAAPYFRVFSPVSQSRKFDPHGEFIRRYVPELASLPTSVLHAPWEAGVDTKSLGYPTPIVDHAVQRLRVMELFQAHKARRRSS
jgi:deoxyribodipyrimidine photo-lyase